jgi:allantoin racemase
MRTLLLINPNTTEAMTAEMARAAAGFLPAAVSIETRTAAFGFPVIASRASYAAGARAVLDAYARSSTPHDAIVIGCFGDPGLELLRAVAAPPVFGLAESSIREADSFGEPFAILTMGADWIEILNKRVRLAAVRAPFRGVFAGAGTGLDVRVRETSVFAELERLADKAVAAGASTLILGGGAFAGRTVRITANARVIDCMAATMRAALPAMAGLTETTR